MDYIPLFDASRFLEERRALRRRVEGWWDRKGWRMPEACYSFDGVLVSGKPVATRRYEDILLSRYAQELRLRPVWMEYTQSKFSTHSPYKRKLLHPTFCRKGGRKGGLVLEKKKLASIQEKRMQSIDTIRLDDGQLLTEYHHRLHALLGWGEEAVVEGSELYRQYGSYTPYLSLFIAHAVLVDDLHGGEDAEVTGPFTDQVFLPAYRELEECFGIGPLVARLDWHEHLGHYPVPEDEGALEDVVPPSLLPPSLQRKQSKNEPCLVT